MSLIPLFALQTLQGEKFVSDVKSGSSSETGFILIVSFLLLGEGQTDRSLWVKKRRECGHPTRGSRRWEHQPDDNSIKKALCPLLLPLTFLPGFPPGQSSIKCIDAQKSHVDWKMCDKIPIIGCMEGRMCDFKIKYQRQRSTDLDAETAESRSSGRFSKPLFCPSPWRLLKRPECLP